jgi:hypothetical protein
VRRHDRQLAFALPLVLAASCAPARPSGRAAARHPPTAVASRAPAPEPYRAPPRPSERESVVAAAPDPAARKLLFAQLGQPAVALAEPPVTPRVTASALEDTARGEAVGMAAEGPFLGAVLAEGQRASARLSIAPGACATFVAHGGLGAIEIDMFLTSSEDASAEVLAEDPLTGAIAVLGGDGHCLPGGAKTAGAVLSVVMRRGSGPILVRRYGR